MPVTRDVFSRSTFISDWVAYTPTITGTTATAINVFWRRVGDSLQIQGTFQAGATVASLASLSLPSVSIDSTKIVPSLNSSNSPMVGTWEGSGAAQVGAVVAAVSSSTSVVYFGNQGTANQLVPANGSLIWASAAAYSFFLTVPIAGWSANN